MHVVVLVREGNGEGTAAAVPVSGAMVGEVVVMDLMGRRLVGFEGIGVLGCWSSMSS